MVRGDKRLAEEPDVMLLGLAIAAAPRMTWFRGSASGSLNLPWLAATFRTDEAGVLRGVARLAKLGHLETAGVDVNNELKVTLK